MIARKRVGVLISGRGSNMGALIEHCKKPGYPAEIISVISNRPNAPGLNLASDAGIATQTIDHRKFDSREAFETELDAALQTAGVELVCNAGFMRLLTARFVEAWRDRHLNIHPSLLPAFKGLDTHERALETGVRLAGCTVHFVRTEMDAGPIVAQAAVPVLDGDTPDDLAARVLKAEHKLYPHALALVASGAARVENERVVIDGARADPSPLFSPALD